MILQNISYYLMFECLHGTNSSPRGIFGYISSSNLSKQVKGHFKFQASPRMGIYNTVVGYLQFAHHRPLHSTKFPHTLEISKHHTKFLKKKLMWDISRNKSIYNYF